MRPIWRISSIACLLLLRCCSSSCCLAQNDGNGNGIHLRASNAAVEMAPIRKAGEVDQIELVRLTSSDIPEPVKQACYSVGKVSLWKGNQGAEGSATYLGNGLWLTNRHVVEGGGTASVTLKSGQSYPARVTSISNSEPDLAVVETADLDTVVKPVPISSEQPTSGMTVYPSGFDFGRLDCHLCWPAKIVRLFSDGDLESVGTGDRKGSISGNSGGPTFTANGELLAPLYANGGSNTRSGLGTCITVNSFACRTYLLPWRERIMRSLTQCGPRGCQPQYGYQQPMQAQPRPVQPPQYIIPQQPQLLPQSPQSPQQPPSYQPAPPPTPAPTVSGPRGEQGPKGDQGPQGAPGPKGDPGEITQQHLAIIAAKVREGLAADPAMRGPAGPVGPAGQSATVDIEAIVQEVLSRMPNTRVVLVDGNTKQIIDDETYKPGEALVFDINKLIKSR